MANKKELTIEELQAQYEALGVELEARKKAEAEERKAKLAAERELRYKAVIDAYERFEDLRIAYIDDYGYFTFEHEDKNGDIFNWLWKTTRLF